MPRTRVQMGQLPLAQAEQDRTSSRRSGGSVGAPKISFILDSPSKQITARMPVLRLHLKPVWRTRLIAHLGGL